MDLKESLPGGETTRETPDTFRLKGSGELGSDTKWNKLASMLQALKSPPKQETSDFIIALKHPTSYQNH